MSYTVSVIVTIYNVASYLQRCVDSILGQTFEDFELLLIDDGSTDDSGAICDTYAAANPRVQVIHKANGGAAQARNVGLRAAAGQYVMFIDGDDFIESDMLESQYAVAKQFGADIVCCGFFRDPEGKPSIVQKDERIVSVCSREDALRGVLLGELLYTSLWNKLYKRTLIPYLYNDENIAFTEDRLANYNAIKCAACMVLDSRKLYHYQLHRHSLVQTSLNEGHFSALQASEQIIACEKGDQKHLAYCQRQKDIILMSLITRIIKSGKYEQRYPALRAELLKNYLQIMGNGLYNRKINY